MHAISQLEVLCIGLIITWLWHFSAEEQEPEKGFQLQRDLERQNWFVLFISCTRCYPVFPSLHIKAFSPLLHSLTDLEGLQYSYQATVIFRLWLIMPLVVIPSQNIVPPLTPRHSKAGRLSTDPRSVCRSHCCAGETPDYLPPSRTTFKTGNPSKSFQLSGPPLSHWLKWRP